MALLAEFVGFIHHTDEHSTDVIIPLDKPLAVSLINIPKVLKKVQQNLSFPCLAGAINQLTDKSLFISPFFPGLLPC
jgi:hypothetical protein